MTARESMIGAGVPAAALDAYRREVLMELLALMRDREKLEKVFDRAGYAKSTKNIYQSVAKKMSRILEGEL